MDKIKIIEINSCNFGSTGNIMLNIADIARKEGNTAYIAYPDSNSNRRKRVDSDICIGSRITRNIHLQLAKLTGFNGCFSILVTWRFLKKVNKIKPDIVHLHNLHNCYINLPLLFKYIKRHNIKTIWTLHDCWTFTGQCPHFAMAKCDKWKTGCHSCKQYKEYPQSNVDRTKTMYRLKKNWFTGVNDMMIVTPSQWLADLVKQSFLRDYMVKVINNGIDLSVFKPTESDFRQKYNLQDKYMVLGVASPWGKRKGLDVFSELAKRLDDRYRIVLVGLSKEQKESLPPNMIGLERTANQTELAEIYSAADVFANPTREDNFPTVNIEALACGAPVVTFNTGGSPEMLDKNCGSVTDCDDIDAFEKEIRRICEDKPYSRENCLKRAKQFDMNDKFEEYVRLYDVQDESV